MKKVDPTAAPLEPKTIEMALLRHFPHKVTPVAYGSVLIIAEAEGDQVQLFTLTSGDTDAETITCPRYTKVADEFELFMKLVVKINDLFHKTITADVVEMNRAIAKGETLAKDVIYVTANPTILEGIQRGLQQFVVVASNANGHYIPLSLHPAWAYPISRVLTCLDASKMLINAKPTIDDLIRVFSTMGVL